jgi:hypothetical protein
VHTGRFCGSKYGAEIVRVLNSIERDDERNLPGCLRGSQNVLGGVIISDSHYANGALMMAVGDEAIESGSRFDMDRDPALTGELHQFGELAIRRENEEALQRTHAGSKGFSHGMEAKNKVARLIASTGSFHLDDPLS